MVVAVLDGPVECVLSGDITSHCRGDLLTDVRLHGVGIGHRLTDLGGLHLAGKGLGGLLHLRIGDDGGKGVCVLVGVLSSRQEALGKLDEVNLVGVIGDILGEC